MSVVSWSSSRGGRGGHLRLRLTARPAPAGVDPSGEVVRVEADEALAQPDVRDSALVDQGVERADWRGEEVGGFGVGEEGLRHAHL